MQHLLDRYSTLSEGRFHRKQKLDADRSPQELSRVILRAKQGDSDAIRYLYLRFADNVYGYARSIVRDDHEAEDVTQQVFTRLMGSIERYEQRSVPFSSWLLRITHNMAIDHIRRRRAVPCEDVGDADRQPHRLGPRQVQHPERAEHEHHPDAHRDQPVRHPPPREQHDDGRDVGHPQREH